MFNSKDEKLINLTTIIEVQFFVGITYNHLLLSSSSSSTVSPSPSSASPLAPILIVVVVVIEQRKYVHVL